EHAHGQEMAAGADPARVIGGEPPAGDETMQVGVELEVAGPGVEDGRHAETGAETVRVEAEGEERAGGRPEEEREQAPTVAERAEDVGDLEARAGGAGGAAPTARHGALRAGRGPEPGEAIERARDALEDRRRHEGVVDRRADRAVAEEVLDRAQIDARLEQVR